MSQRDLLDPLAPAIHAGWVVVHESDEPWVGSLRRRFPVRASGVRWEELPNARSRTAEVPRVPLSEKTESLQGFLREFGSAAGLDPDDRCVVFGDGATEMALELPFRILLDLFPLLFSSPQTNYVLTPDASWCFAFTFEEDMDFAKSPPSHRPTLTRRARSGTRGAWGLAVRRFSGGDLGGMGRVSADLATSMDDLSILACSVWEAGS